MCFDHLLVNGEANIELVKRRFAESMMFLIALIWGGSFVAVKGALDGVSAFLFLFLRFFLATAIFLTIFHSRLTGLKKETIKQGFVLGVLLCVGYAFQTLGLEFTTASKSGFITGLLVVFTPIFQWGIERRIPKLGNIVGVILVSIGLWFLTAPGEAEFTIGDGLTLVCAIFFALYIVYLDMVGKGHDAYQLTFVQLAATTALSLVGVIISADLAVSLNVGFLAGLAYTGILATVVTTLLQTRYQTDTSPTRAAVIFTLEPIFAAIIAYLVLTEVIGVTGILGGALIVCGLILSQLADLLDSAIGLRFSSRGAGKDEV
ncbi:MAG TPA: DMT family transporter [Bacteroidota bacterium]